MPKKCIYEGCQYNQFSGKYCILHQWCRKDKEPKYKFGRNLRKISKKAKGNLGERKKRFERDKEFYLKIWEERKHFCENCGVSLGDEPLILFFDHIKEKSKFPKLRYEKNNIMLLCWNCHSNKTNGQKVKL